MPTGTGNYPIDGGTDALWMATAVAAPDTTTLSENEVCDVCIIGAGFTGLNAALDLAIHGVRVCVLEAGRLGQGASGRSGGQVNLGLNAGPQDILTMFGREQGERLLARITGTPDEVFNLIRTHGLDCDPVQNGWTQGATTAAQLHAQAKLADEYTEFGGQFDILDSKQLADISGVQGYRGGLFCAAAGSLQPLSYTRELARLAMQKGARIFTQSKVVGLSRQAGRWEVHSNGSSISCEQVLVCSNGYTDSTVAGLDKKIVPVRSILTASEPLCDDLKKSILPNQVTFVDKRRLILYLRYDRDGRLCVGDHGPMRDRYCLQDYEAVKKRAIELFPALSNTRWDYHWGGRVAATKDALPFVYVIAPGLTAAMGYNGRGVGMGSVMGKILSENIRSTDATASDFPVTHPATFKMHRFHRTGVSMFVKWYSLLDHLESISNR